MATSFLYFVLSLTVFAQVNVRIPIETLYFKPQKPKPLQGLLWYKQSNQSAILLFSMPSKLLKVQRFAKLLHKKGFNVLYVSHRQSGSNNFNVLIEDLQSGVVFLKTSLKSAPSFISVIAENRSANGLVRYLSVSPQMNKIVNKAVLLSPMTDEKVIDVQGEVNKTFNIPVLLIGNKELSKISCLKCTVLTVNHKKNGFDLIENVNDRIIEFLGISR